jgi:hypothetical protein
MTDWAEENKRRWEKQEIWEAGGRPVLGHLCNGLRELQAFSTYGCIPNFREDGTLRGCDAENETVIKYCPMCGEKL